MSADGKLFAYIPREQKMLWMTSLEFPLVGSTHRSEFMQEGQPFIVPTVEGDLALVSSDSQNMNVMALSRSPLIPDYHRAILRTTLLPHCINVRL